MASVELRLHDLTKEQRIEKYKECLKQFGHPASDYKLFNLQLIQSVLKQWAADDPDKLKDRNFTDYQVAIDTKIAHLMQSTLSPPRAPRNLPKIVPRDPMAKLKDLEAHYRDTGDLDNLKLIRAKIKAAT